MILFLYLGLGISLASFLLEIFLEHVKAVRVMLFAGSLLGIVVFVLAISYISLPKPTPAIALQTVSYNNAPQHQYSQAQYDSLLTKYLYLISVQPTHRDLLVNLSLLYQAQGDTKNAEELTVAAKQLDPNNPQFLN